MGTTRIGVGEATSAMSAVSRVPARGALQKLNVGCGLGVVPGYHNLDNSASILIQNNRLLRMMAGLAERAFRRTLYARFPAGVRWCDVTRGLPYESRRVEVVYSSHMIEHLARWDAEAFLNEAHRVLVPGGLLRLAIPDLERMARKYLERLDQLRAGSLDGLPADEFVASTSLGVEHPRNVLRPLVLYRALFNREGHSWMWDGPSLRRVLEGIGFHDASERGFRDSSIPEIAELEPESRRKESVYVEARR